jgi:hypothetical protein
MDKKKPGLKLTLRTERLRPLSTGQLARIIGGTAAGETTVCTDSKTCPPTADKECTVSVGKDCNQSMPTSEKPTKPTGG